MSHVAAMVCHGGSGTVTMGMAGGVPMAAVPLFADAAVGVVRGPLVESLAA